MAAGSDAGSGAAITPSGDVMPMTHRAGMCPSTVYGATTKSMLKGKSVIVTVESDDRDAVAAIQKRTNELLAEKAAAGTNTGGGHDMKGSHGGSQGLCPVHVPDGAKVTSKPAAKGVVVTITPKDKPDQLAADIAVRIDRAAAWVKANVPDAPQGNQGGVGGGKGNDGSNHSGMGDGKGHLRHGGGGGDKGGGGGNGTGGGGGNGTGGGGSGTDGKAS